MRHRFSLGTATVLLAVAAAVGGCTSSSGSSSAASCNSPGVTPNEIRLGYIYPDSGVLAGTFAAARAGVDARLGLANANGGVNGRKIVYDWRDDQGVPDANSQAGRELVDQQNVFGLIESTFAASGSAPYLSQKGVPVTGLATEAAWAKYRNMFSFSYTDGNAVTTFGTFMHDHGGSKVVLVQAALSGSVSELTSKYQQSVQATPGLTLVDTLNYSAGADNPAALAQRIISSGADTVVFLIEPPAYLPVLQALRTHGGGPRLLMAVTGYDRSLLDASGPTMAGLIIPIFYRPFEVPSPAVETYEKAMTQFSPQLDAPQHDFALMSYVDTDMFVRGLEAAGPCPTRQGFIDGLRSMTNYDAGGLIKPTDFKSGLGKQTNCYSFVRVNPTGTAFEVAQQDLCGTEIK